MSGRPRFKMPPRDPARPKVPEARELIRAYYEKPGNLAGGNLHIVLDDGNLKDADLIFARDHAQMAGDVDGVTIAEMLMKMTPSQRRRSMVLL